MSNENYFIILIDALRHDFVDPERTPFLFSLKQRALRAQLIEPFNTSATSAYFSGHEFHETETPFAYEYNPELSPFSFLKKLRPACTVMEALRFDRFFRSAIRKYAQRIEKSRGRNIRPESATTAFIPLSLLPFFAPLECQVFAAREAFFEYFAARGLKYNLISGRFFESIEETAQRFTKTVASDVAFIQFSELARIGKYFGPRSMPLTKALKRIDNVLRRILEPALDKGAGAVIFGNHGLVEVINRIDMRAALRKLPLRAGKDFVPFLDNTRAFFWFLTGRARSIVEDALSQISSGHILSVEEKRRLNLNPDSARCGEMIFAANGGSIISPSFSSPPRGLTKGMHGYLPEVADNASQLIAAGANFKTVDLGILPMTQIHSIIRDHLVTTPAHMQRT